MNVSIRRATPADLDFLVDLYTHEKVEPFLAAARPKDREALLTELARDPQEAGIFVIEVEGERAGTMSFEVSNRRSRIASLAAVAVHPSFRGRRIADDAARLFQQHLIRELGYHRLQLEIYQFNERAIAHAERAGFVREGVRRKAYQRHGEWVDGILFGLIEEELEP